LVVEAKNNFAIAIVGLNKLLKGET